MKTEILVIIILSSVFLFNQNHCETPSNTQRLGWPCKPTYGNCGVNAICGNGKCICKFGYTPDSIPMDGSRNCDLFSCDDDQNYRCNQHFGPYTRCHAEDDSVPDSSSICACDESFHVVHGTQKCSPFRAEIGSDCGGEDDCGENATCGIDNKCVCKFGHVPITSNRVNCQRFDCFLDSDCDRFGNSNNSTRCYPTYRCICTNNREYEIDFVTQKCILKSRSNWKIIWICVAGTIGLIVLTIGWILFKICISKKRRANYEQIEDGDDVLDQIQNEGEESSNLNEQPNQEEVFESIHSTSTAPPEYSNFANLENVHTNESDTRDYASCVNVKARHMF